MVTKYFNCPLWLFCEKWGYDRFFVELIKKVTEDEYYANKDYIGVELDDWFEDRYYEIESGYSSYTDNRSIAERIISLGVNWVVEDILVHKSSGTFILTGCDNSRDLLSSPITNVPDIRYVGEGKSFYVEVCSDFNSFMERYRRYDLRKIKFFKMSDLTYINKQTIVLMFVDVVNKKYLRVPFNRLLLDIDRDGRRDLIDKYKYNTVCFEFRDSDELKPLDDLFESLKKLSKGYISENNSTYKIEKEENKAIENENVAIGSKNVAIEEQIARRDLKIFGDEIPENSLEYERRIKNDGNLVGQNSDLGLDNNNYGYIEEPAESVSSNKSESIEDLVNDFNSQIIGIWDDLDEEEPPLVDIDEIFSEPIKKEVNIDGKNGTLELVGVGIYNSKNDASNNVVNIERSDFDKYDDSIEDRGKEESLEEKAIKENPLLADKEYRDMISSVGINPYTGEIEDENSPFF